MNVEGNPDERMGKSAAVPPQVDFFFIETFAVIGTDDDDGIFKQVIGFQCSDNSSDLFVGIVQGVFVAVYVSGRFESIVECQMIYRLPIRSEGRFIRSFRK